MWLLKLIFYILIFVTILWYILFKTFLCYWSNRGILHEKAEILPRFAGYEKQLNLTKSLQLIYQKYKGRAPFVGFYAFLKPILIIIDMDYVSNILNNDTEHFEGFHFNQTYHPNLKRRLHTDDMALEKSSDKIPPLQQEIKMFTNDLVKVQKELKSNLRCKYYSREFKCNISELVEDFNIDVIYNLAYSGESDSLREKNTLFRKMWKSYTKHENNIFKDYIAFCYPKLASLWKCRLYSPEAASYFNILINKKLYENRYSDRTPDEDGYLLKWANNLCYRKADNAEATARAFSFITAGLESCQAVISTCLYQLALNPKIQMDARIEIKTTLRKYKNELNEDAFKELVYLKQILYETLRLYSPYPWLLRETTKDYELPNSVFMLKKGDYLTIPIASIHIDPAYYEHPTKFDPNHFHSTKVQNRPPCAFLPFGVGPRSCVAQQFAEQHMLFCLAMLLNLYSFKPYDKTVKPFYYDGTKILRKPKDDIILWVTQL